MMVNDDCKRLMTIAGASITGLIGRKIDVVHLGFSNYGLLLVTNNGSGHSYLKLANVCNRMSLVPIASRIANNGQLSICIFFHYALLLFTMS